MLGLRGVEWLGSSVRQSWLLVMVRRTTACFTGGARGGGPLPLLTRARVGHARGRSGRPEVFWSPETRDRDRGGDDLTRRWHLSRSVEREV